ncbi:MAG: hypothetical protein P9M00_08955 [Candidatus Tritonobacter lacicola]|nr:hypothetical protein [Candidatus Tritonobacter lacicola]
MSIIHEALKKAGRKREGLYRLIQYEPFQERLHIERPDREKRYAVITIIALVAINVSIFAWNFSLKSEMRRLALAAFPDSTPVEHMTKEEFKTAPPSPYAEPEIPPEPVENRVPIKEEDFLREREEPLPELILKGTMLSQRRSRAFINNSMVKEGDVIEGAEVLSIRENRVLLRKGDREFEVKK